MISHLKRRLSPVAYLFRVQGFFLALCLVCMLVIAPTAMAQSPILSAAEIDYPPFCMLDDQGRAGGFSVELMRAALAAMGREATFRTGTWEAVQGWLEQGKVQVLPLVGRTPEREFLFDFTFPYMPLHGAIVVRKHTGKIQDLEDLRGRTVAVMKGDNAEEFLRREDRGIHIHTTATFEQALQELSKGHYDAVVIQRLVALRLIQETNLNNLQVVNRPIEGFRQDFCFAVREGDRKMLALLNEGLALVMADGTYRHLHAKWFAALELPSHGRIVIGGDHNFPPYEYLDKDGRPAGYNVDLTKAIAEKLGLDIEIRLQPWKDIRKALAQGEIDALQGMFYSPERDLTFDVTPPHAVNHCVSVVRSGEGAAPETVAELSGKRIVVQQDDIMHDFVLKNGLEDSVVAVDAQEDALRELAQGKHDCALVSRLTALYWIDTYGWQNLSVGKRPFLSPEYCYAVPNNHKALLAHLGEGLKILDESGEYRSIQKKWLGVYKEESLLLAKVLRYSAMVLIPLVLIGVAFFLWSWSLRKQVAHRTAELAAVSERQQAILDAVPDIVMEVNVDKIYTWANPAGLDFFGDEVIGRDASDYFVGEQDTYDALMPLFNGDENVIYLESRQRRRDGRERLLAWWCRVLKDNTGKVIGALSTARDITERRHAEEALRQSENRYRLLADNTLDVIWTMNLNLEFTYVNPAIRSLTNHIPQEWIGSRLSDHCDEEHLAEMAAIIAAEMQKGVQGTGVIFETVMLKKNREPVWLEIHGKVIYDDSGQLVQLQGVTHDITERKRSELHIQHLNQVLRAIRDVNQLIVRERDPDKLIQEGCRLMVENRGYRSALIVLTDAQDRPVSWASAGLARSSPELTQVFEQGNLPSCCSHTRNETGVLLVQDRERICGTCPIAAQCAEAQSLCMCLRHDGSLFGYLTVALAEPIQVNAEEISLLAEMADDLAYALSFRRMEKSRRKIKRENALLQQQMIQAQKMESIGRLAGGVAHDYNNMLSVIIGNAELALDRMALNEPLYEDLNEILKAARRSSDITRQLLAFARKQTIRPEVLDLNESVEGILKMLRRLIGEDIDLAWQPQQGLWPVSMDPSQLDQILANLCVNARDAIAGVGKISITTRNISFDEDDCAEYTEWLPGDFVLLTVSDSGHGMSREILDNIFEPFFTTKDMSQGTGLGLAVVYGIVKQNNGFIHVTSEPEAGTVFKLYLPRYAGEDTRMEARHTEDIPPGHGETVLMVEDESSILKLGGRILRKLGYTVLEASTPAQARNTAQEYAAKLHLLVTDVIMPEMNGKTLADQLLSRYPDLKVLFISGYTADVMSHMGVLPADVHFMQKPFSFRDFAVKVREVLDA